MCYIAINTQVKYITNTHDTAKTGSPVTNHRTLIGANTRHITWFVLLHSANHIPWRFHGPIWGFCKRASTLLELSLCLQALILLLLRDKKKEAAMGRSSIRIQLYRLRLSRCNRLVG